jgi:hypothetical protein
MMGISSAAADGVEGAAAIVAAVPIRNDRRSKPKDLSCVMFAL